MVESPQFNFGKRPLVFVNCELFKSYGQFCTFFGQVGWLEIGIERDYFNIFKIILPEQAKNPNQPKNP